MGFEFTLEFCSSEPSPRGSYYTSGLDSSDPVLRGNFIGGRFSTGREPIFCLDWELSHPVKLLRIFAGTTFKPRPHIFGYEVGDLMRCIEKFKLKESINKCCKINPARITIERCSQCRTDFSKQSNNNFAPCCHSAGDFQDLKNLIIDVKEISGRMPGIVSGGGHSDFVEGCNDSGASMKTIFKSISKKFTGRTEGVPNLPLDYLNKYLMSVSTDPDLIPELVGHLLVDAIDAPVGLAEEYSYGTAAVINPKKNKTENIFDSDYEKDARPKCYTWWVYDEIRKLFIQNNNKKMTLDAVEASFRKTIGMPSGPDDCTGAMALLKNTTPREREVTVKNADPSTRQNDYKKTDPSIELGDKGSKNLAISQNIEEEDSCISVHENEVHAKLNNKKALAFMSNWHPVLKIIAWVYLWPFLIGWLIYKSAITND